MNKVFIVLLNFNGAEDTIECLESVLKLDYSDFQVIVIDNSKTVESFEHLVKWAAGDFILQHSLLPDHVFPLVAKPVDFYSVSESCLLDKEINEKIIFVKADENKGFAAGNNIALRYVLKYGKPDSYIWLLNNDTVVSKNSLSEIVSESGKQNGDFICGTPLIEYYNPSVIQAVGGIYNTKTGSTSHLGEGELVSDYIRKSEIEKSNVDYPVGASMIISKSFLEKLGLLCEDYFLFFEELDWSFRAKAMGRGIKILSCFGVFHKQGNATHTKTKPVQRKSEFIDLLSLRNRIIIAKKFNRENIFWVKMSILVLTTGKRLLQRNFSIIPKIVKLVFKG